MVHSTLRSLSIWILKGVLIIWLVNALLFVILVLSGYVLSDLVSSGLFSKISLLEAGLAFIVGGAIAFSGSILPTKARENILKREEEWSLEKLKKSEKTANKYISLAVILFLISMIISILGF
jgi:hypothetical protein